MNQIFTCQVCLNGVPATYSITECKHKYCLQCCQSQLISKIKSFDNIKCLDENCPQKLNQNSQPYLTLQPHHKQTYEKYKRHKYFQQNPNIKPCKRQNCEGQFVSKSLTKIQCIRCLAQHCSKCFEISHEGECDKTQDENMKKLGYRECLQCHIYVQKIDGCDYISCKCGNVFCYKCGVDWVNDPCRLRTFQYQNQNIRTSLGEFRWKRECSWKSFLRIFFVGIFQVLVIPLIIIIAGLFVPVLGFVVLLLLIVLLSPILVAVFIYTTGLCSHCIKVFLVVLVILLYPLMSVVSILFLVVFTVMYPCFKGDFNYHHGIFDPLEELMLKYVGLVIGALVCIIQI